MHRGEIEVDDAVAVDVEAVVLPVVEETVLVGVEMRAAQDERADRAAAGEADRRQRASRHVEGDAVVAGLLLRCRWRSPCP